MRHASAAKYMFPWLMAWSVLILVIDKLGQGHMIFPLSIVFIGASFVFHNWVKKRVSK